MAKINQVCFAAYSVLDFLCHNRTNLLFIDTLIYRLLGIFCSRRKTMSPSLLHEWIHLFSVTSGSHLFCPATAAGSVCVGGLQALGKTSALPRSPCPAGRSWTALFEGSRKKPVLCISEMTLLYSGWNSTGCQPRHNSALFSRAMLLTVYFSSSLCTVNHWWVLINSDLIKIRAFTDYVCRCNLAVTKVHVMGTRDIFPLLKKEGN